MSSPSRPASIESSLARVSCVCVCVCCCCCCCCCLLVIFISVTASRAGSGLVSGMLHGILSPLLPIFIPFTHSLTHPLTHSLTGSLFVLHTPLVPTRSLLRERGFVSPLHSREERVIFSFRFIGIKRGGSVAGLRLSGSDASGFLFSTHARAPSESRPRPLSLQ